MILPIGDEPNPRGTPWVTWALIATNVVVFLTISLPLMGAQPDFDSPSVEELLRYLRSENPGASTYALRLFIAQHFSAYDTFTFAWGYRPAFPSLLTLFTSMFLHGGWLHLLGNMLFLWIFGDNVEHRMGRVRYLVAYLTTGAIAAWTYGLFVPKSASLIPLVGASGAISGVLGLYFLWFPRNKVRVFFFLFVFFGVRRIGARWVLGFYLIAENLLPVLATSSTGEGVAYGAHIGGFVAGLGVALLYNLLSVRRDERPPFAGVSASDDQNRGLAGNRSSTVASTWRAGQPATAVRDYLSLSPERRAEVSPHVVAELADWLATDAQPEAALAFYRRALADHPNGPGLDRIFLGIGLVLLDGKHRPTAAYQYLMDALDSDPSPNVEKRAREALARIARTKELLF